MLSYGLVTIFLIPKDLELILVLLFSHLITIEAFRSKLFMKSYKWEWKEDGLEWELNLGALNMVQESNRVHLYDWYSGAIFSEPCLDAQILLQKMQDVQLPPHHFRLFE
jgi:hypothetical protein